MDTYDPNDSKSSPYEPVMGDIVIYKTHIRGQKFPAIVVQTHAGDVCDLSVFTDTGTRHYRRVPFNSDPTAQQCWCWPQEKRERRPIKNGDTQGSDKELVASGDNKND